jgi:hypothetical protein
MNKVIFLLAIAFTISITTNAQFKQQMGPAMNMDNSIGTILMELSTPNKEVLMNGESDKTDTAKKFYPSRLFGANQVYISRTMDETSLYEDLQDETTVGQIYAVFTTNDDIKNRIQNFQTNLEKSTVFNMFFKINNNNKDANRIEYVQSKAFTLPNNSMKAEDLAKYNKGLKENFEQYEIMLSIEKGSTVYMGVLYEYPQVRSWVQLKPIPNLAFELPDDLPTLHATNGDTELANCLKYVNQIQKLSNAYDKLKKDFTAKKNKLDGLDKGALRQGYTILMKRSTIVKGLIKYITDAPKFSKDVDDKVLSYGVYGASALEVNYLDLKNVIATFTFKY